MEAEAAAKLVATLHAKLADGKISVAEYEQIRGVAFDSWLARPPGNAEDLGDAVGSDPPEDEDEISPDELALLAKLEAKQAAAAAKCGTGFGSTSGDVTPTPTNRHIVEHVAEPEALSTNHTEIRSSPQQSVSVSSNSAPELIPEEFAMPAATHRCMYDYNLSGEHDIAGTTVLRVRQADQLKVTKQFENGWLEAANLSSDSYGLVPESCLVELTAQPTVLSGAGTPSAAAVTPEPTEPAESATAEDDWDEGLEPPELLGLARPHRQGKYVHTVSIEAVLAPFADRLSTLIVTVANSRTHQLPIPDISEHGLAVATAGNRLRDVAKDAMADGDHELKSSMSGACETLERAIAMFTTAARDLKLEPLSASASAVLIDGTRGLLHATTDILSSYDMFDIRKIVSVAQHISEQLGLVVLRESGYSIESRTVTGAWEQARALYGMTRDGADKLVALVRVSATAAKTLDGLLVDRVPELRNMAHRDALQDAKDRLRQEVDGLLRAVQVFMENRNVPEAWGGVTHTAGNIDRTVHEVIDIVLATDADDNTFAQAPGAFSHQLEVLRDAIARVSTSPEPGDVSIEEALSALCGIVTQISGAHARWRSTEPLADGEEHLAKDYGEDLDQLATGILGAVTEQAVAVDPPTLYGALVELDKRAKEAAVAEMSSAAIELITPARDLVDLANGRFPAHQAPSVDVVAGELNKRAARMVAAADGIGSLSDDPSRIKLLRARSGAALLASEDLVRAARVIVANPNSQAASRQLQTAKSFFDQNAANLLETTVEMMELARVLEVNLDAVRALARTAISAAERQYPAAARSAVRKMLKRVDHVVELTLVEQRNTTDSKLNAELATITDELKECRTELKLGVKQLCNSPDAPTTVADFNGAVHNVVVEVEKLFYLVAGPPPPPLPPVHAVINELRNPLSLTESGAELQQEQTQPKEVVQVTGSPLSPIPSRGEDKHLSSIESSRSKGRRATLFTFSSDEQPDDKRDVMDAAYKLSKAANCWMAEDNPIVKIASEMAELMAKMVHLQLGGPEKMGDLVTAAKAIVAAGGRLVEQGTECAKTCLNRTIQRELMGLCERIPTIGVQLKILSSVKATSMQLAGPNSDPDTDSMLVTNAQNLMSAVQRLLKTAAAASLKQKPPSAAPDGSLTARSQPSPPKWRRKSDAFRKKLLIVREGNGSDEEV